MACRLHLQHASPSLSQDLIWPSPFCTPRNRGLLVASPSSSSRRSFLTRQAMVVSVRASSLAMTKEGSTNADTEYMKMCVSLAREALGHTSPNPMVGCVLVKDGCVIGKGFHPKAGQPHAEVFALREAGMNAKGATAYVSLEPCNHFGRTPPCTQALIQSHVSRVVVGTLDPNPIVAGRGVETLKKAGIEVNVGVEEASCQALIEAYIHRMVQKRPFATLRYSASLDGSFLGSDTVDCGKGSYFSKLLQENDAIIVSDAALVDNPTLLCGEPGAKQPLRIILSNKFDFPMDADVLDTSIAPTLVVVSEQAVVADLESSRKRGGQSMEHLLRQKGVDVEAVKEIDLGLVLSICHERGFCSVLVDARSSNKSGFENSLGRQALEEKVLQKLVVAISPTICGNTRAGLGFAVDSGKLCLEGVISKMSGQVVVVEGYIPR